MIKKYLVLLFLVQLTLSSCTKINIITDPFWKSLISDFQGKSSALKFQAFVRGGTLNFTIIDVKEGSPYSIDWGKPGNDIYLLSPLLSSRVSEYPEEMGNKIFYVFENKYVEIDDIKDNLVVIKRDRRESFFETGKLLSRVLEEKYILPVIYSLDNYKNKDEVKSFFDGISSSNQNIDYLILEVSESTTEKELREFFDKELVKKSEYIAFFANKLKNLCYDMSERDSKYIVTSDSWFVSSFDSLIFLSVEDDIKGMMKKVYSNVKNNNFADIRLEGIIYK